MKKMQISRILKSRAERLRFLQYAPWLAQTQEEYEAAKTRALQTQSLQLTPILTVNGGANLFAWAPMDQEEGLPQDSEHSSFHEDLIEDRLKEIWSIALSCTPSLGFSCRWFLEEPPPKNILYCLIGEGGLIQGHSLSASLLIGYILWISELRPLQDMLVSANITSELNLGIVDGIQNKLKLKCHLPIVKNIIIAEGNQKKANEVLQDTMTKCHTPKNCQKLVELLWGDRDTQKQRSIQYIKRQTLDALNNHIDQIFDKLRGTRLEGINHHVHRPLIEHLRRLEEHPKYLYALDCLGEAKAFELRMLCIALCRHLNVSIGSLEKLFTREYLERVLMDPTMSNQDEIDLWLAEYIQTHRDALPQQESFNWSTYLKEPNAQQDELIQHSINRINQEDKSNSFERAMLLGSVSRVYLLEGRLTEARELSMRAIKIWKKYERLGKGIDHELGRPFSVFWRSFRLKQEACSLMEAIEYSRKHIKKDKDFREGWLFISHECVKSGLWKLRTLNEQSTPEAHNDVNWVRDLSLNLLHNICSVLNIRHSLIEISLPKGSFYELIYQQHSNYKDELKSRLYLVGSLCGAIYQSADQIVTSQSEMTPKQIRDLCYDIWDRLLEQSEYLKEIFMAQKALATLAPTDLERCRWDQIQGISYMAQSWAKAGIQPNRIETFFKDPSQDAELLFELYQRADYIS